MRAIVVAALIGLAAVLTAPTAANAAACWQRVLEDWHDGQLDADYPVQCYRSAIVHLPEDLRVYGTAESDIQNAMARALARDHAMKRPARPAVHTAKPSAAATAPRTSTRAGKGTRRLVGRAATQPRVTLAAAPDEGAADSAFPTLAVAAGAAALGGLLLVGAGARYAPRRRRPH